ncbi:MAG: methionine adenosyltransferase domain-containing protein [Patescibacteria group bacterium]|nr:methionine adenosyltransferase domain-containing protein [Patescibacteria group bacterium]
MLKTVEVPLIGHPDKVCDQIVDAILDEYLRRDEKSRVDVQALGSNGMLMIGGTVDSRADFDSSQIARRVYREVGYEDSIEPFVNIERPSEDRAKSIVLGGSQGTAVVHGYATRETREMLPRAVVYAHALARRINDLRLHEGAFSWMCPDGKIQLTMDGDRPVAVTVLVQHACGMEPMQIKSLIVENVIVPILGDVEGVKLFVNTAGEFCTGGFSAGAGASGRKTLADTYGGLLPSGGSNLSGRDPLHPARAGSYMARFAAKNLVAQGVAGNILISAGYTIGQSGLVFLEARTGEGKDVSALVKEKFDFRPEAVVERLNLDKPIYEHVSVFGHFGREGVPWEEVEA